MNKETLENLVKLQAIDTEKLALKRQRQDVVDDLKRETESYKDLQVKVAATQKRLMEIRVEGQNLNLEQRMLEEKSVELKKKMDLVRNTEESRAVGKELVDNETKMQQHFEKLDRQNSDLNDCMQELARIQSELFAKRSELEEKLPKVKAVVADFDAQVAKVDARRKAVHDTLSEDVQVRYRNLIKTRAPHMVVKVESDADRNHTCSGCNIGLPPQVIGDIIKCERVVCCENCGRILYLEEELQTPPEK